MVLSFSGCGTILYPERSGQDKGGKLDVGIVLLDGIGLFFFIVPGVVAYAVDFTSGTIYLPSKGWHFNLSAVDFDKKNMKAIHLGKENMTPEKIGELVSANVGHYVDTKSAQVYKIKNNS